MRCLNRGSKEGDEPASALPRAGRWVRMQALAASGRNGGSATGATGNIETFSLARSRFLTSARAHGSGFGVRGEMTAYCLFAAYAAAVALLATGQDALWAAWAVPAYAVAAVALPRARTWGVAMLTAAFAVAAPLLLLLAQGGELAAGMAVIERSAVLLVRDGTPYLPSWQLSSWLAYNPYLPAMALFGLPSAAGLRGAPGDPRVWLVLVTVAALGAAFATLVPHSVRACPDCRRDLLRYTAFAVACPVMALNLAVTTTDPPVLALMLLALGLIARPQRWAASAVALGLACAMKPTAWLAIPVLAVMLRSRDGTRQAIRYSATALAIIVAVTLPAVIASPVAMIQNTVLFPLGLTRHLTPAQSLMPGDLLARTGSAGHVLAAGLLIVAGLAIAVSLAVRPPRDLRAATWRLALGLALMFALGPAERFGYFIYPLGLAGWLVLTRHTAARQENSRQSPLPSQHRRHHGASWSRWLSAVMPRRRKNQGQIAG
jgi:Glycosyltransferase family 87